MKKFFSTIFLVFVSLYTFGQSAANTSEALFDFTDGSKLNPAVTEEQIPATVTDSVFRSGPISVAFDNSRGSGAPVFWGNYLWMHRGETLMISCPSDYELLRIEFSANTEPGGFSLASGSKGTFNYLASPVYWVNEDHDGNKIDGITSVHLYNSNQDSKIRSFTVTYRSPLDDLVTETITPENGSTVNAFDNMTLTFDQEIASTAEYFLLTDGTGTVAYLKPSISGKTVTLKPSAALEENGTYRVSFPKKSFISTEGSYNKAFSTSFKYVIPKNTFNPVSITPAEGAVEEMPETIELDFRDPIGNRANEDNPDDIQYIVANITDAKTGVVVGAAQGSLKSGTENILVLTSNLPADARTKRGIYTVTIPEQKVFNQFYNTTSPKLRYNSEIVITYKVAGADAPSEEVLAEARKLLNKTGVGYPKADAAERTALKEAVDAEDKGDKAFRTLMDNFMASTDIDMPEADKYYTIANVQKNGTKYYLAYDGEAVTLTTDAANAYSFKASATYETNAGNVRTFSTADGKYLHTLVASTNYSEATPANVTSEKKAVSSLSLVKMPCQANSEAEQVFGYIAMSGLIGKKYNQGDDITAFSNVLASGNIAEGETSPFFMESLSGAFFFAEAEAPKVITKYTVAINPASETGVVEALESIVVTFPELTAITLADASKISLKGVNTNVVVPVEETPVVKGNTVTIKFGYLPNDTYTFTAAEGAFTYVKDEETVTVQEITTSFTVNYVDEFVYDLDELPNVMIYDNGWGDKKVNPEELNHFSMQLADERYNSIETYLSDKRATVIYNYDKNMATGQFVKTTSTRTYTVEVFKRQGVVIGEIAQVTGSTVVLKDGTKIHDYGSDPTDVIEDEERVERMYHMELKLDKVLNAQNCPNGIYWILIEPATFGDENFGKWVSGEAIAKHECHVNNKIIVTVEIDNTISGIRDVITTPNTSDDVIYDLSGRRVNNMTKPGLYIMNGKKFVVK